MLESSLKFSAYPLPQHGCSHVAITVKDRCELEQSSLAALRRGKKDRQWLSTLHSHTLSRLVLFAPTIGALHEPFSYFPVFTLLAGSLFGCGAAAVRRIRGEYY